MNEILAVLAQNILPILMVAGFGYALRRRLELDAKTLSAIVFNVLSPALVFSSLVGTQLPPGEILDLAGFTILSITITGGLAFGLARLLRLQRVDMAALMITVMFANSGNYGLTLLTLRYDGDGLARGVVYYVTSTVMLYTVGMLLASMGRASWRTSLRRLLRLPAFYAAVLAVIVYSFRIPIPGPILRGVEVAGAGAIPVMLLVLGMQIADLQRGQSTRLVWPAVSLRLIVGPLVGVAVAALLGLRGLGRSTSIIETAMPTAVFTIILASEFGLPTSLVARIVVISTLISPLTVAVTISLLGL